MFVCVGLLSFCLSVILLSKQKEKVKKINVINGGKDEEYNKWSLG